MRTRVTEFTGPATGYIGQVLLRVPSIPREACGLHLHACAATLYVELGGSLAQLCFDPVIGPNNQPRALVGLAVASRMAVDYLSPAEEGSEMLIDAKLVRISKKQAVLEVALINPETSQFICKATYTKVFVGDDARHNVPLVSPKL